MIRNLKKNAIEALKKELHHLGCKMVRIESVNNRIDGGWIQSFTICAMLYWDKGLTPFPNDFFVAIDREGRYTWHPISSSDGYHIV